MSAGFLSYVVAAWLACVCGVVVYKLATGEIPMVGLLSDQRGDFSPERAQLLLLSLYSLAAYLGKALEAGELVEPDSMTMWSVAGSQSVYIVGKFVRSVRQHMSV